MATQLDTPERRTRLVQLAGAYKGRCLKDHPEDPDHNWLCPDWEHYVHTSTKVEVVSLPVNAADVRDGRAVIAHPCHGLGIVELARAVSGGPVVGPMRVAVQHEELSDLYGVVEERVTGDWKQEDRETRSFDRKLAQQHVPTGEVGRFEQFSTGKSWRRRMDPIEVDGFVQNRPKYYLQGYGVDDKLRRYAKARIPGTNIVLHVDVSQSIQELSQRKRKWLHKHGVETKTATTLIEDAVAQWWAS